MKLAVAVALGVIAGSAACGDNEDLADEGAGSTTQTQSGLFDCNDPSQRLVCAPPATPGKRFVCHATRAGEYTKIAVAISNGAHLPGHPHGASNVADQAPGASADDTDGAALDCECEERICAGTCTGAVTGSSCDDGDLCTGNGTCAGGDTCEQGAPSCVAGTAVDACTVATGACEAETGACLVTPAPAGTTCDSDNVCNSSAECVESPHVILNDIDSNGGVPGDWVELYNAGASAADLSGWRFLDNDDTHAPYVIPTGTIIAAGGYLVLEEAQFGFELGGEDSARLYDATGEIVDSYSWTAHAPTTYGRCTNGVGAFRPGSSITKGAANDCSVQVRVNEIESNGGTSGDWVELYNAGSFDVDLAGYTFRDADARYAYVLPPGTTIAAGGFVVLEEADMGFGLASSDSALLLDGATIVDSYVWTADAATTYGRCPDGSGAFGTTTTVTKGAPNNCAILVGINEVESNGGVPGDWVELHNAGPAPVDIGGWIFRDNDDTHGYAIPAGTTIAANGYVVIEEAAIGFGLGSADSARLFNGTMLVDSYAWTAHAATTYGRCPDVTGAFGTTTTVTKGAANDCSVHVGINEVESSGGVPGDWVELHNAGPAPVDIGGWIFRDNDDTHTYAIPAGTMIAANGYFVLEEAALGFGLGNIDSARLFNGTTLVDSYAWTAHAVTTYGRCPDMTGAFGTTTTVTKGAANDCSIAIGINEVESSGGVPGDWVELHNAGPVPVDIGGWIFRDSDDTHTYAIPAGTMIASHGYVVLDEAQFGFGLGAADSARLFNGTTLVDSYAWTAHAAVTYGRCPDMTGTFADTTAATKGAANNCGGGGPTGVPWPGANTVATVDAMGALGGNLSGLFYDGTELWAARNNPGELVELTWNGTMWTQASARTLHYPNGTGNVDAEDVTKADLASPAFYVAAERDNDVSSTSRLSILRYDTSASGTTLSATHEWNLTADLPAVGANLGLEAITWIPDAFLVANSFFDAAAGHAYNPADYPGHGTGIFFVGVEQTGMIYAYALDHTSGTFTRVASIASGDPSTKSLSFDRDLGYLWAYCGSACGNQAGILQLDTTAASPTLGTFVVRQKIAAPSTMPNIGNEGIAFAPLSQCMNGQRPFWWTDDGATDGHALRADTIPCTAFVVP